MEAMLNMDQKNVATYIEYRQLTHGKRGEADYATFQSKASFVRVTDKQKAIVVLMRDVLK